MNGLERIKEFLEKEKVNYQIMEHYRAFTALEVAEAQHVPGRKLAKTVIIEADGKFIMCVLPATEKIDFEKIRLILDSKTVGLAHEAQVAALFPGYEVGAMPPFGQMEELPVFVDRKLEENETIAFNAGTHTDVIRLKFTDFLRLAKPIFADFGVHI